MNEVPGRDGLKSSVHRNYEQLHDAQLSCIELIPPDEDEVIGQFNGCFNGKAKPRRRTSECLSAQAPPGCRIRPGIGDDRSNLTPGGAECRLEIYLLISTPGRTGLGNR
eukprot:369903-Hanusia_phi.AAC.1